MPSQTCESNDYAEPCAPYPIALETGLSKSRQVTEIDLIAHKMDEELLHDVVYAIYTRAYAFNIDHQLCAICKKTGTSNACVNVGGETTDCRSCLELVGGYQVMLGIRREH